MSPTSYQAALPRVILSLLSATLIIIPYSNGFVKRVRKVFLQRKQRMKTRLLTFFPENQQPRQFTPLREGRLLDFLHRRVSVDISIHAPPRGATRGIGDINTTCNISIHAPPRGATRSRASASSSFRFQFTPLREGRQGRHGDGARRHDISIHAPPRGATIYNARIILACHFNSRPSARGD